MPPGELQPFQDELSLPTTLSPVSIADDGTRFYRITMRAGSRKIHKDLAAETPFWGYEGTYPGPTIEVPMDSRVVVEFTNSLAFPYPFLIPPYPEGAAPAMLPPVPWTVVHLHGSPNHADHDGWADNAFFPGQSVTYHYPAQESPALLWYHDHGNMITRLNVYAGLAGFYLVRHPASEAGMGLPIGPPFELPLLIQDRDLEAEGDAFTGRFAYQPLSFNDVFFGTYILVNGQISPYANVEPRTYRLRLLNGSNSRTFRLKLLRPDGSLGTMELTQVGVDGGFLPKPVPAPGTTFGDGSQEEVLILAPAERADVLIDLSGHAGRSIDLVDDSGGPFNVLRFIVSEQAPLQAFAQAGGGPASSTVGPDPETALPQSPRIASLSEGPDVHGLHDANASPPAGAPLRRPIGLFTVPMGSGTMQTINGRGFHDTVEEVVELDTIEEWEFLNVTGDDHPMHLHLVNFRVIERQKIVPDAPEYEVNFAKYFREWVAQAPAIRGPLPQGWSFDGDPIPADANEIWPKDTVRANAGYVTRIRVHFRLRTGLYMYHCHFLEHEDMEMMRPLLVVPRGMRPMAMGSPSPPPGGHSHGHGDGHGGPAAPP